MKYGTIVIASLLFASSSAGFAQSTMSGAPARGRMAACQEDEVRFCADKTGHELRACLESERPNLSDDCKASLSSMSRPDLAAPGR